MVLWCVDVVNYGVGSGCNRYVVEPLALIVLVVAYCDNRIQSVHKIRLVDICSNRSVNLSSGNCGAVILDKLIQSTLSGGFGPSKRLVSSRACHVDSCKRSILPKEDGSKC